MEGAVRKLSDAITKYAEQVESLMDIQTTIDVQLSAVDTCQVCYCSTFVVFQTLFSSIRRLSFNKF
jgi:hypothetical protein